MSMIESVRDFLLTYSGMANALIHVDALGNTPIEYAVIPLPGDRKIAEYLDGKTQREYPFLIQSVFSTADEAERIENSGFYETLADWLEEQSDAGNLPTLGSGKTAESINAVSWGFVYEQGESGTGIYQISCVLRYEQG